MMSSRSPSNLSFRSASSRSARFGLSSATPALQHVDWDGLEMKFRELVSMLNAPSAASAQKKTSLLPQMSTAGVLIGSEARRMHRENMELGLEAIIEVALSEAMTLLINGDFQGAIRGGLLALKFVQEVYGTAAIEQIEPFFLLSKANQFMSNFTQAEEYLSMATWTILKNDDCPVHVKAELHQNFGLLYVNTARIEKSIEHLATCIYYLSLLHGTDHLVTSFGYFNLGNVFASQNYMDKALDFFGKVVDIWYRHLKAAFNQEFRTESYKNGGVTLPNAHVPTLTFEQKLAKPNDFSKELHVLESLDREKVDEASRMFDQILQVELQRFGESHVETGKTYVTYGLYLWWIGSVIKARDYLIKANEIFARELGETSEILSEARQLLDTIVNS